MNEISTDEVKLWVGELWIENRLLQKELSKLRNEVEEIKRAMLGKSIALSKEEETKMNHE